jgi:hypothetical protein
MGAIAARLGDEDDEVRELALRVCGPKPEPAASHLRQPGTRRHERT